MIYIIDLLTGVYNGGSNSLSNVQYIVYEPSYIDYGTEILKYCIVIPNVNDIDDGCTTKSFYEGNNYKFNKQGDSIVMGILIDCVPLSIEIVFSPFTLIKGPGNSYVYLNGSKLAKLRSIILKFKPSYVRI